MSKADGEVRVRLEDGEEVVGSHLLMATARRPHTSGLGLEKVGIEPGDRGIEVDERYRAADGVWAVGDVTGVMPFTHAGSIRAGSPRTRSRETTCEPATTVSRAWCSQTRRSRPSA